MKLLTKALLKSLPLFSGQESGQENVLLEEKIVYVRLFCPWSDWTWYMTEYDPESRQFFGFVEGFEGEWGYSDLNELEAIIGPVGLKIERDLWFQPKKFREIKLRS